MQTNLYSRIVVLLMLCLGFFKVSAQDVPGYILSGDIKKAHANGVVFAPVNLFSHMAGEKHPNTLREETLLAPNALNIQRLYTDYPEAISLKLKTENGKEYTLELMHSSPLAFNPNMGTIDASGRHRIAYTERGAHYQGAVAGVDKSIATLSAFANGDVMILFATDEGNFVLGRLEDNSGNYIFYNDKDFVVKRPGKCGVSDADYPAEKTSGVSGNKTTNWYQCNKVSIYWEADYDTYVSKLSNATLTRNYLIGLFNQVQTMYRNERVAVELKSIYIWTTADTYDTATSNAGLTSFKNAWNAKGDAYDGDLAMLLARDQKGNGGIAFLGVLCNKGTAYAYGDINANYNTVPTYSWDVEMVTHEHGHNMGSKHTFWCGWNTGPSGTCGAIDNCSTYAFEPGSSCSTCPSQYDDALPVGLWQGSVMSYCHLVTRGTNLANGFGPLPGNKIRTEVAGASCLASIISATITTKPACTADGEIILTWDADTIGKSNFSCAPYRFVWSNGPTSQNQYGMKVPGNYTINIEDSNGCKKSYTTYLAKDTGPGCWKTGIAGTSMHNAAMKVYPNPAHNSVNVNYNATTNNNSQLKITDVLGRVVYTKNINTTTGDNTVTIPTEGWVKGIYYIQLSADESRYPTVKLTVE